MAGQVAQEVDEGGAAAAHERGGAGPDHQGRGEDHHLQEHRRQRAAARGARQRYALPAGTGGQLSLVTTCRDDVVLPGDSDDSDITWILFPAFVIKMMMYSQEQDPISFCLSTNTAVIIRL